MCTLVLAHRVFAQAPVVVAANRDELYARAALGPRLWDDGAFYAPLDVPGGGTWLGVTRMGTFVGVTNRFGAPKDDARSSRGLLVLEALRRGRAQDIHTGLRNLSPTRFNAFHLLYADRDFAGVTWTEGKTLHQDTLAPGLHVVTERSLGADDLGRTEAVRAYWVQHRLSEGAVQTEALKAMLALKGGGNAFGDVAVAAPEWGYGTRSSTLVTVGQDIVTEFADGPPGTAYVKSHPFASL